MNHVLKSCLCFAVTFVLTTSLAMANGSTKTRELHAAPGTPEIDGEIEVLWQTAPIAKTDRVVIDGLQIPIDEVSMAKFRCLWDAKHLYVLAEIEDANLSANNDADWQQDSVEFFVDENFARSKESLQPATWLKLRSRFALSKPKTERKSVSKFKSTMMPAKEFAAVFPNGTIRPTTPGTIRPGLAP